MKIKKVKRKKNTRKKGAGKKDVRGHFRVAIFGSARIKKNDPTYKLVHTLAKMIAKEGMDVVTGGGPGLMQAANAGHHSGRKDKNLHSIGLTIKLPMEQQRARHLDVVNDFKKFSKRLDRFMQLSDAVIVAPGGVGTTLELFYTWQLVQVKHICDIPIILLGDVWKGLIEWIKKGPMRRKFLDKEEMMPLFMAKNCKQAMKIIKEAKKQHDKGKKKVCYAMNIKSGYRPV